MTTCFKGILKRQKVFSLPPTCHKLLTNLLYNVVSSTPLPKNRCSAPRTCLGFINFLQKTQFFGSIKALLLKYRWDFTSRPYEKSRSNPRSSSYWDKKKKMVIPKGAFYNDICTVADLHFCYPETWTVIGTFHKQQEALRSKTGKRQLIVRTRWWGSVTYRFMNEIIVTNESEWAEHMYVVFTCYALFMLLCIISSRVLD